MKKKVLWIISEVEKSCVFEWELIRLKNHFRLHVILLNEKESALETFLKENNIHCERYHYKKNIHLLTCFFKILIYCITKRPGVVHCHLTVAELIGLSAAFLSGIPVRIYTRHNSSFHHLYHKNHVWMDKLSNMLSTQIISISSATDYVLKNMENVRPEKIIRIPHGLDFEKMKKLSLNHEKIRKKYSIPQHHFVVGVISRAMEWKGIQFIIPAFQKFIHHHPDSILVIANFYGPYKQHLMNLLEKIPPDKYRLIEFEHDIFSLYKNFHLFLHVPVNPHIEAFGLVYIESLASGIPLICSLSGIAPDIITNQINALTVNFNDPNDICEKMLLLKENEHLKETLIRNGKKSVEPFHIDHIVNQLIELYNRL